MKLWIAQRMGYRDDVRSGRYPREFLELLKEEQPGPTSPEADFGCQRKRVKCAMIEDGPRRDLMRNQTLLGDYRSSECPTRKLLSMLVERFGYWKPFAPKLKRQTELIKPDCGSPSHATEPPPPPPLGSFFGTLNSESMAKLPEADLLWKTNGSAAPRQRSIAAAARMIGESTGDNNQTGLGHKYRGGRD